MVEWQDGTLVTPAKVNEDGTITPAVYEGDTPFSAYNLNKMQADIYNDGIIISATEPSVNRRKVWMRKSRNIIPTNVSAWESGQYSASGAKLNITNRARLSTFLEITPGKQYYCSLFTPIDGAKFIIRTLSDTMQPVRDLSILSNGNIITARDTEKYLAISLGDVTDFDDFKTKLANGTIKPFICSSSETDKSYEPHAEPTIYIKNANGNYDEFIKKYNDKIIMNSYSFNGLNVCLCKRNGFVNLMLSGSLTEQLDAATFYDLQLDDDFKPIREVTDMFLTTSADKENCMLRVQTTGTMRLYPFVDIVSKRNIRYNTTYMALN